MKRMLFNATQTEELRVAIVDGQKLLDLDIETTGKEQRKSNIYKGVITRIEPSLEAAFVDYGADRHGFLPFKEVNRSYFNNPEADPARARIQDALKEGQQLIVQVDKDERGTKGAALTTFISLAGRYLVLMPNNPRGGGVSRRIEGEERNEVRDAIAQLDVPQGMSTIARTAGIGRSVEELQWDLSYLLQLWRAIDNAAGQQTGAFLIYQDASLVIRAIRDYFHQDIGELLIDTESIYDQAQQFMGHVMPQNVDRVKLYKDDVPLFSRFQIEHQIETAYSRQVSLPSGGSVVIDHTEAMVAVDVNSARATKGSDIEETALRTNLEASDEIARQLRLRDLGGLVVIDFIDMEQARNQREVELRLRDALKYDRARVQTGKISRFGLLELSRQRLQTSLGETSHIACSRCSGTGHIRSIESTALHVLRIMQEEAMKENTAAIHAQVPVDVATYLLNEKRNEFHLMEQRLKVNCLLIPNVHLETPHYSLTRLRHDELNQNDVTAPSYTLSEVPVQLVDNAQGQKPEITRTQAAVQGVTPAQPAPARSKPVVSTGPSILQKIIGWFTSSEEKPAEIRKSRTRTERPARPRREERNGRRRDGQEHRERRPARNTKSAAAGATDQSESRPENNRQRQQPSDAKRSPRREQPRQQSTRQHPARDQQPRDQQPRDQQPMERSETVATAAIEQRPTGARPESEGAERTGRKRRRRSRGSERRPSEAPTANVTEDTSQSESPAAVNAQSSLPRQEDTTQVSSDALLSGQRQSATAVAVSTPTNVAARDEFISPPEQSTEPAATASASMSGNTASDESTRTEPAQYEIAMSERETEATDDSERLQRESDVQTKDAQTNLEKLQSTPAFSIDSEAAVVTESSKSAESPASMASLTSSAAEESYSRSTQVNTTQAEVAAKADRSPKPDLLPSAPMADSVPVASTRPAETSTSGWKMEPIRLPSDMELVETRTDAKPVSTQAVVEPKRHPQRRPAKPKEESSFNAESLVQIETGDKRETDNAENP